MITSPARTSHQPVSTLLLVTGDLAVWHNLRTSLPGTLVLDVLDHHHRQQGLDVAHGHVAGWTVLLVIMAPPLFAPRADEVTPGVKEQEN